METSKELISLDEDDEGKADQSDKTLLTNNLVCLKVEVRSELNLGQWFLQLQEKSLLGFASLLVSDTPGIRYERDS